MRIFAAHNPNTAIREQSSSGGIFSMLAEEIIRQGGVVYGAAFDDSWNVVHKRVDSIEGLAELRGSKYVYSNATKAYSDALEDLAEGKTVLFSGTPCQIAAMKKRAGGNKNLLLIEVVCHGAPKPEYWRRYLVEQCAQLKKSVDDISLISFRDKRTGWKNYSFSIKFKDGKEYTQPHGENPYMRAFLNDYTLREACFNCPFKYPDGSQADITLGDMWGISQIAPEIDNDEGTTLIIGRTDKGETALMRIYSFKTLTLSEISKYNPAITTHAVKPSRYSEFQSVVTSNEFISEARKYTKRPLILRLKIYLYNLINKFKRRK